MTGSETLTVRAEAQVPVRLMGRGRALEVMLSAEDYDAEAGRAVRLDRAGRRARRHRGSLARRIARFPAAGRAAVKDRVNAIALAPADESGRDSDLFGAGVRSPRP